MTRHQSVHHHEVGLGQLLVRLLPAETFLCFQVWRAEAASWPGRIRCAHYVVLCAAHQMIVAQLEDADCLEHVVLTDRTPPGDEMRDPAAPLPGQPAQPNQIRKLQQWNAHFRFVPLSPSRRALPGARSTAG